MPRPIRCRRIGQMPAYRSFSPDEAPGADIVRLSLDEFEALRLIDREGKNQEACAAEMNVARTTVTAIYLAARRKVAEALTDGKRLIITGGCCEFAPAPPPENIIAKGKHVMRIAVTYENGNIFQHFGHTRYFKVYDVENNAVVSEQIIENTGSGHGALAGFLRAAEADTLICGGIGMGAQMALAEAGIRLYGGASGNADDAVRALLTGTLKFNPDVKCDHHDHGEGHTCASHGCGHQK